MPTDAPANHHETLLVTGAAGFIGSNLVHWILKHRPAARVISLDALTYAGNLANLEDLNDEPRHRFVRGSICDLNLVGSIVREEGVDAVINLAAHTHVDRSLMGMDEFVTTNVGGVQTLLDVVKAHPRTRLLHVSTDEVYGSQAPDQRVDESAPLHPNNPYAATKAGGDMLALAYQRTFDLDVLVSRCSNNYGPYQYPEKVIPLFITNLLDGKKVPLYGDGLNVREWIHVEDHASAIMCVLERGRAGEVYNITSGEALTNLDLTESILEMIGMDRGCIEYVQDRPGHDRRYAIDDRKLRAELGWKPAHRLRDGLRRTVDWYRAHEAWWRPIKSGQYRAYYERQYAARRQP